jgi:anhydro-N-acetylmuramic acid kinase
MSGDQATAVGVMCGSSLDGVDVVWLRGAELLRFASQPLSRHVADHLRPALLGAPLTAPELAALDVAVARTFVDAVRRSGSREAADFVACHGVTVGHNPASGYSWQLGDLATVARGLATTAVGHFRSLDVAGGGQGAPLAPLFHRLLFGESEEARLVLNLGGIANLSELPAGGGPRGYDLGPCNLLLDALHEQLTGGQGFDRNGRMARRGRARADLLAPFLDDPFLRAPPPKSTGREQFGADFAATFATTCTAAGCSPSDTLRTACHYVAANVAEHVRRIATANHWQRLILCGGGCRNHTLVEEIGVAVAPLPVETTERHGIDPDAVEAVGFALLGDQCLRGVGQEVGPITGGTGHPILGQIQPGPGYPALLRRLAASAAGH